ncbi:bacteriohemerythrin [Motiliproteus sediminis]|uniref:bacteriohemerythrin n=1 Tax=Motiliproteus sediminis TaxID=1468178 RepID=UPI001AF0053F|nr:hemerythrin domain-containing protein [Motiliproteus sediminis]
MPIIWQPAMSVGAKAIDDEHKYLFALVNCVELALKTGEKASISLFLDQLIDYCQEHFSHEEKLQLSIRYPYYAENKRQHIEILENLQELRQRIEASVEKLAVGAEIDDYTPEQGASTEPPEQIDIDAATIRDISELLRQWILEHVLVIDRKMHPFLTRLGEGKLKQYL